MLKQKLLLAMLLTGLIGFSGCSEDESDEVPSDGIENGGDIIDDGDDEGDSTDDDSDTPVEVTPQTDLPVSSAASLGQVWVDSQGLTLYTFENDRLDTDGDGGGDSDCNAACAENWPPLTASATAEPSGDFSIITRDDGVTLQWAFSGMPLYFYSGDSAVGDTNGENVGESWFVARPYPFARGDVDASAKGKVIIGNYSVAGTDGLGGIGIERIERDNLTLYTFENDRADVDDDGVDDSACNDACAETWPPLYADKGATPKGSYTVITRNDGTAQWAFNGLPLYFFNGDNAAGDTEGEGLNNVWFVARPNPVIVADSSAGSILTAATTIADVDATGAIDPLNRAREGFSLYVFDNDLADTDGDGAGDSDCNADCAVAWPPVFADSGATATGNYSLITRDDGTLQWAYNDQPLYFYNNDLAVGDINGDQIGDLWHLARTAPVQIFTDATLGDIFAAKGNILDVDANGEQADTSTDKTGFTVYLFDNDTNDADQDGVGDSDCNGECAVNWPPLYATASDLASGDFTIIAREDGSLQWAYKGSPLYFFGGDTAAGETGGVNATWHEVKP